jgi:hypothetical protein
MTEDKNTLDSNVSPTLNEYLSPKAFEAITGKPASARRALPTERDALIRHHVAAIAQFEDSYIDEVEFSRAFCRVLDMYEAYLDAACDLTDEERDELCFRLFIPRQLGFDRYVQIAKLQKQAPAEIENGLLNGKKWASDPTLLKCA